LPVGVVKRAREILKNLEANALDREGVPVIAAHEDMPREEEGTAQLALFTENTRDVLEMMRNADLDNLSPIEALNLLARMKKYKISENPD